MRKITAKKYDGDDRASWAIFVDNKPFFTGLFKNEVPYYRRQAEAIFAVIEAGKKAEKEKA